jgi:hypothetical protein
MGWIDFGTGVSPEGIEKCPEEYSATEVFNEPTMISLLRSKGLEPNQLLQWGTRYDAFAQLPEVQLLFLFFRVGDIRYLRTVNRLGQFATTVILDVSRPNCKDLIRSQKMVLVQSHPPIADVLIDGRKVGEAPIWVHLKDGAYVAACLLPGQTFKPVPFTIPHDSRVLCQRENSAAQNVPGEPDKPTIEEGVSSVFLYLVGSAASIAAIVVPFLIFR